jgi:hypothetical protein
VKVRASFTETQQLFQYRMESFFTGSTELRIDATTRLHNAAALEKLARPCLSSNVDQ